MSSCCDRPVLESESESDRERGAVNSKAISQPITQPHLVADRPIDRPARLDSTRHRHGHGHCVGPPAGRPRLRVAVWRSVHCNRNAIQYDERTLGKSGNGVAHKVTGMINDGFNRHANASGNAIVRMLGIASNFASLGSRSPI